MIRIDQFQLGGSFVKLLNIYTQHINASLEWIFGLEKMTTAEKDKIFSTLGMDIEPNQLHNHFSLSYVSGHSSGYLVMIVPEKLNLPFFNHLMMPFSCEVWIVILAVLAVTLLVNRQMKRHFPRNMVSMIFFGSATAEHNLMRQERFLFASLSILMFLLSESYLAIMLSYMLNVKYQDHLQTVAEFDQSSIPICLDSDRESTVMKQFFDSFSSTMADRIIYPKATEFWYKSCSWMARYESAEVYLESRSNFDPATMRRKFYMLPQMLTWTARLHSMSRMRPFMKHFAAVQRWMTEGGFWQHWNDAVRRSVALQGWDSFSVFSFDDLITLWYILICGYLVSVIVLIGEISCTNNAVGRVRNMFGKLKRGRSVEVARRIEK